MSIISDKKFVKYILPAAIAGLFFSYLVYILQSVSAPPGFSRVINITPGESVTEIGEALKAQGIVRSALAFKLYGLFSGGAHIMKPGFYYLSSAKSTVEIVETLVAGPQDITLQITEGASLKDVNELLEIVGLITTGELANFSLNNIKDDYPFLEKQTSLEGFLFPDTYKFAPNSPVKEIVKKMLDNFAIKAYPLLSRAGNKFYDALKIASIIEKEVPDNAKEREIVSGIIARRLKIGMGLQVDATVLYAKCGGRLLTCMDIKLNRSDFSIDSPYNTYLHSGLPPTPVSNPGESAIKAAINPQKTAYLFYLSDPKTKKTIFSKDLDEHNDNRAKYLGI